jgi:hypothetical protein
LIRALVRMGLPPSEIERMSVPQAMRWLTILTG